MITTALVERNSEGTFFIFTPDLKDFTIMGTGDTVVEAMSDFETSVQEVIESYASVSLPEELQDFKWEYRYDLGSLFDYYSFINVSALAKRIGINPSLMRQYKRGQYISKEQMGKIEKALREIGTELSAVSLT
ncbi:MULTISPECIES: hypothetical protein [Porphyromonas]|uniref:hypothetical protein n=1 Tax=Porphyromonas TaxID=836 RepID=UPI00051D90C4|nr:MULTISPECIES: hypothetical protein [Porphyromonas]KGL55149.1 hypothetical protein HQ50_07330 [Porphyromonas sp. COT-052 OH4946]KGN87664.1 hypothetical protein HQ46_08585 [Porphyromonas gulae]